MMTDLKDDLFGILLSNCNQIDAVVGQLMKKTLITSVCEELKRISSLNDKNRSLITNFNSKKEAQLSQNVLKLEQSPKQQISTSFSQAAAQFSHVTTVKTVATTIGDSNRGTGNIRPESPIFTEVKDAEFDAMLDEIVDNNNQEQDNNKIGGILQSVLDRASTMCKDDIAGNNSITSTITNPSKLERVSETLISSINGTNLEEKNSNVLLTSLPIGRDKKLEAIARKKQDDNYEKKQQHTNKDWNIGSIKKNIVKFASKLLSNPSVDLAVACAQNDTSKARELLNGKYNIDVNYAVDFESLGKYTALQWVCIEGNLEIFQLLMEHKPKLNILDNDGKSLLMLCLMSKFNYTMFKRLAMLVPDSQFNIITKSGFSTLMVAAAHLESIERVDENIVINTLQLIEKRCSNRYGFGYINKSSGESAVMYAFAHNDKNLEVCKYILDRTPSNIIDIEDENGRTAFMIACSKKNLVSIVAQMVRYGNKNDQDYAHMQAINTNKRDFYGHTPLFYACTTNNHEAATILCEKGDLDIDLFAFNDQKNKEAVSVVTTCITENSTQCLSLVLKTIQSADKLNGTDKLQRIIDFYSGDQDSMLTPLKYACLTTNVECVSILLQHGASVNLKARGLTPMMAAIASIRKTNRPKDAFKIVNKLLDHMDNLADIVNVRNKHNMHALGWAVFENQIDIARILCQKLSEIEILTEKLGIRGNDGISILEYGENESDATAEFINGLYTAYQTNDVVKVRSLLTALTKNQERSVEQYWKYRKQNRFCTLFLKQLKSINVDNEDSYHNVMNQLTHAMCDIFARKMPMSDDMMILAWKYCQTQNQHEKMFELVDNVIRHSLSHENPCKTRDYLWFKKYLLNSNIWYQSMNCDKSLLVYDMILKSVDKQLNYQRLHLGQAIDKMKNESSIEAKEWNNICSFKQYGIDANLRQDDYKCNQATYSIDELRLSNDTAFDSHKEYETKVYLTNLLITARSLNTPFQSGMKQFIKKINPNAIFQSGSPKLMQRCLIKSQTVLFIIYISSQCDFVYLF